MRIPPKPRIPVLNNNHPLARNIILCVPFHEQGGDLAHDLSKNRKHCTVSPDFNWVSGTYGRAFNHDAQADRSSFGDITSILPTSKCTILIGFRKTDTTNRDSGLFGIDPDVAAARKIGAHCPYSDGTVYFDFGGSTNGTTRVQVASLTISTLPQVFCFTTGARGMEIWQNGLKRASNAANPTRTNTGGDTFKLGNHGGAAGSDFINFEFFFMWNRQLTNQEIQQISRDPWVFLRPSKPFTTKKIAILSAT